MEKTLDRTLDVREMEPKDRHSTIFETFGGLNAGESFVLINDHEPKPLLYQLQTEHDGEFDWWVLEAGPEAWRVRIGKRRSPDPKRTVTEFLQTDHRRLDGIYETFRTAAKDKRWSDAGAAFAEFNTGLRRHIQAEEEILFPVFEEKTGMTEQGPTFVMKMEHKDIKDLMDSIIEGIEKEDADVVYRDLDVLTNVLADHNMKEENILYPESDAFMSEDERTQVVKKAQAI